MSGEKDLNADSIRELASSFQKSRVLLTAFELDLFTAIDGHMITSAEVAARLSTNAKATDRLMNALVAMGFLRKVHGKFYNSSEASRFLVAGKEEYIGALAHTNSLWDKWSNLTDSVITGTPARNSNRKGKENWRQAFIAAMHYRASKEARLIAMMIDLPESGSMLDIGGGSGAYSFEFIKCKPGLRATIFDLPDVLPITEKYVIESGMKERVALLAGNYNVDPFGSGYNLIFLSSIVHINSYEENKLLIKKCEASLKAGGQIIIKDFLMNEERTGPLMPALFALNMLVGTERGDAYTESEIREWFVFAGISKIEKKETGFGSTLIIGHKN